MTIYAKDVVGKRENTMLNLTKTELEYVKYIFRDKSSSLVVKLYRANKGNAENKEFIVNDIDQELSLVQSIHEKLKKL